MQEKILSKNIPSFFRVVHGAKNNRFFEPVIIFRQIEKVIPFLYLYSCNQIAGIEKFYCTYEVLRECFRSGWNFNLTRKTRRLKVLNIFSLESNRSQMPKLIIVNKDIREPLICQGNSVSVWSHCHHVAVFPRLNQIYPKKRNLDEYYGSTSLPTTWKINFLKYPRRAF